MTELDQVRERPILFSAPMVRAILDGRKTQTRRVAKVPPQWSVPPARFYGGTFNRYGCDQSESIKCPYGVPGDRLYVKEAWGYFGGDEYLYQRNKSSVGYRADHNGIDQIPGDRWRPSIFMPRWASRLTLEITAVRVEQLNQINANDAKAEGVVFDPDKTSIPCAARAYPELNDAGHIGVYRNLWDSINGKKHPWASNPYVWCLEFRRVP
jgi:hypothetical protein